MSATGEDFTREDFIQTCMDAEDVLELLRRFEETAACGDSLDRIDWINIHQAYWAIKGARP
jgi:hypothetical protein